MRKHNDNIVAEVASVFCGDRGRKDKGYVDGLDMDIAIGIVRENTRLADGTHDGVFLLSPWDASKPRQFHGCASKTRMRFEYDTHVRHGWSPVPSGRSGHVLLQRGRIIVRYVTHGKTQVRSYVEEVADVEDIQDYHRS